MLKIRLSSAFAATLAAALMTFVTVVPPPASAQTVCAQPAPAPAALHALPVLV